MSVLSPQIHSMKHIDGIIVTVTGYVWKPGDLKIKKELGPDLYREFVIYMAEVLRKTFYDAIKNQRYKSGSKAWKPLSISYLSWKKRNNLSLDIWKATGTLQKEIKVFKKGDFIAVGFKQSDYYPNSTLQINKVARYLEYGGRKIPRPPSRPLFRPILEYLRKNISRYYKKFKREKGIK